MFSRHALWPRAQASQLLPRATGPGDQQVAALGDPVAGGELEEQRAVEPARTLIVDVLDAGRMTQLSDPGVTLHEILRLGRFFAFAAGNSETRTDSSLEFAANVRMPDERRRAV